MEDSAMNVKQPTPADYEQMPKLFDDEHEWPRPGSVDLDAIVPPLSDEERLAIRLAPTWQGELYQRRLLNHAHLSAKVVYDADRRNCSIEGGYRLRNSDSLTHHYRIEDGGKLYHITLLDDVPAQIDCQNLKQAVEQVLLAYWRAGVIEKIPYWAPDWWSGGPERPPYEKPKRRALTAEEQRIREQWEHGEIYRIAPQCPSEICEIIQAELHKLDVQQGQKLLREAGLFVGVRAFNSGLWTHWGGPKYGVKYDRDNPDRDDPYYRDYFWIDSIDSHYKIDALIRRSPGEVLAEIAPGGATEFDTFTQASEAVIRYYRLLGLIEAGDGVAVAGHSK